MHDFLNCEKKGPPRTTFAAREIATDNMKEDIIDLKETVEKLPEMNLFDDLQRKTQN